MRRSRRIVFADPAALRDLEAIVHPLVRPRILAAIAAADAAQVPAVAIEAIKLVEGGLAEFCDVVWWVTCHEQRARLIARGVEPADADRRITAQAGMAERVRAAREDVVEVDTSGSLAEAETRIAELWERLVQKSRSIIETRRAPDSHRGPRGTRPRIIETRVAAGLDASRKEKLGSRGRRRGRTRGG